MNDGAAFALHSRAPLAAQGREPAAAAAVYKVVQTGRAGGASIPATRRKADSMSILGTIIIGLLVGLVAKFLMPGRDPGGFIVTILLGIVGAFVATWLGQSLGWYGPGEASGFIGSVIGAMIVLFIYRLIVKRRAAS
jgi:uncharacterized membrane protein YeaQ/YmgE (transglycosylase-associated protein family)